MNLYFRLILLGILCRFRTVVDVFDEVRTAFRVWPTDIDVLMHMNNGVYFSMMDLGRVEFMMRSGLWKKINAKGWYPVVASETMSFKRSLGLFSKFEIVTKTVGWDDKFIYIEQTFVQNGKTASSAVMRARFLSKKGELIAPSQILQLMNHDGVSPELPAHVVKWREADVALYGKYFAK